MSALIIELPESVTQQLNDRRIPPQQVRAFVVEAVEAWLRMQEQSEPLSDSPSASRFAGSPKPFVEKLVRENRALFEKLASL